MARILSAVLSVNLGIGLVGMLYIWWRSQDASVVDLAATGGSTDPQVIDMLRSDAAGAGMTWWAVVLAGVVLCALVWLLLAERARPANPQQARSAGGAWWLLLLLALVVAGAAGGWVYVNQAVAYGWRVTLIVGGMVVVPLAYWLATALGVKTAMTPSAPLASLIRR